MLFNHNEHLYNTSLILPKTRHTRNPWKVRPVQGPWRVKSYMIKRILCLLSWLY